VVSPVIDWAAGLPEVDPERIALFGNSMSVGLAPRSAAFEPRIRALICIDGIYDIGWAYAGRIGLGDDTERGLTAPADDEPDAALVQVMAASPRIRWAMRQGMWSFGVTAPRAFLAGSLPCNLRDGIAESITCPVFVGKAESDEFFKGQPEQLAAHLKALHTLAAFTGAEGASALPGRRAATARRARAGLARRDPPPLKTTPERQRKPAMSGYTTEGWNDLFVCAGGATAALSGLIFVGLSVNLQTLLDTDTSDGRNLLTGRAMEALAALLTVLMISIVALAPGTSAAAS
jgi:hypothetical protein